MSLIKRLLFLLLPVYGFGQTVINPGGTVTISCATCPACPSPVIIHDTVKTNTTLIIHDTVKIKTTLIIHDSVCPSIPPVVPPVTGTRNNLILENTFDDGKLTGFTLGNEQYCIPCGYALNIVTSPDGKGKSVKYDLKSTDPIISSSKRSEMQLSDADAPQESERWYGLKYWLEKYDTDNGRESILQWHDVDGTTPPLSIQAGSGSFTVMQSFSIDGQNVNFPTELKPYQTGKWISFVLHVKWTTADTGILQVWRDGVLVVNKKNTRTNSKGGSYMKIGINKWSWAPGGGSSTATERIFYIDDFRMGNEKATYNDVAP